MNLLVLAGLLLAANAGGAEAEGRVIVEPTPRSKPGWGLG
jgi:hypothetical protein